MADEETVLSGDEAKRWYQLFEGSEVLIQLFSEEGVDANLECLERFEVREGNGEVTVTLYHEFREGDFIRARGFFDEETEKINRATLVDGDNPAPFVGQWFVWEYEDGEITGTIIVS